MKNYAVPAVAAAALFLPSLVQAAALYGGPTYDPASSTGFDNPSFSYNFGPIVGDGVTIGNVSKYVSRSNYGGRAFRWNASSLTELTNLGANSLGRTQVTAVGMNAAGVIVGRAQKYIDGTDYGTRAVRWSANGILSELGTLGTLASGYANGSANAVNGSSIVVGSANKYSGNADYGTRAVRWNAAGVVTELGNLGLGSGNGTNAAALALNAGGTSVGWASKWSAGNYLGDHAVRWAANSTLATELGNLGVDANGLYTSQATALNDAGTAIGFANKYENSVSRGTRAVRWDAGSTTAVELGLLGTDAKGNANATARAINAAGTIIGNLSKYGPTGTNLGSRAVRWDAGSTVAVELGNLGTSASGSTLTQANGINASGTIVGQAQNYPDFLLRAVAWDTGGSAFDLNTLLPAADKAQWTLTEADGISDTNWIAGVGTFDADGTGPAASYRRAFLLKLPYAGDADGDDDVDFNDFLALQNGFNQTATSNAFSPGDFNYDGVTDFNDFLILQNHFGQSLGGASTAVPADQVAALSAFARAVPEPGAMALALMGIAGLTSRRTRER